MPAPDALKFRMAEQGDAQAVAALHTDSWQRHYRGAYADAFLDDEVPGFHLELWTSRFASPDPGACTVLAELDQAGDGSVPDAALQRRELSGQGCRTVTARRPVAGSILVGHGRPAARANLEERREPPAPARARRAGDRGQIPRRPTGWRRRLLR